MFRRIAVAAASLGAFGAAGAALAADQDVVARDSRFNPARVALKPGETLTVRHDDGAIAHSLQFTDEPSQRVPPSTKWTVQRTFAAAEARDDPYVFFCSVHAGMRGFVYVNATGTVPAPSPTPTPTATPTATASPTATPTATPPPGGPAGDPASRHDPGAGAALAERRALRVPALSPAGRPHPDRPLRPGRRARDAQRRAPGAKRFKRYGTVRFGTVAAGPRTLRFTRTAAGKRLRAGRYTLALRAAGERRTLRFRVH